MKKGFTILLILLLASCAEKKVHEDQVVFDRIEAIFNLKSDISKNTWKTFDEKQYDVPLIHYMDSFAYVANPTGKFLKMFDSELVYETPTLKIYKTGKLPDNDVFHMETTVSFGDAEYYDDGTPFMKCSSFEKTRKTIPDVESTEVWMTMVIHEYFHGFQNKHQPFLKHFEKALAVSEDSLERIYKANDWFKANVDQENDLLLKALASNDTVEIKKCISEFFKIRNARRKQTKEKLGLDIEKYESVYETMEGTARCVEYGLYRQFSKGGKDLVLSKSDRSYKDLKYFKNHRIENDPWLYLSSKTSYFYAIGFNMTRLMDKLQIEYKSKLFDEGFSLEGKLKVYQWIGIAAHA